MMEYALDVFVNTPDNLDRIDTPIANTINNRAKDRWHVHKIWRSYRGTRIAVLYERMRIE